MIIDFNAQDENNKKLFFDNISNSELVLSFKDLNSFYRCIEPYLSGHKIKNKRFGFYYSAWTEVFQMYYDNIHVEINKEFLFEFKHLKKNNSFTLKKEGGVYLFPWNLFYKEIIRRCEQNDILSSKKKLIENAKNFKIMNLHAELEESGIYNLKQENNYLYYISGDNITKIFIKINRTDKTLHINDQQKYYLDVRKNSARIIFSELTFEELKTKILGACMLLGIKNERVTE